MMALLGYDMWIFLFQSTMFLFTFWVSCFALYKKKLIFINRIFFLPWNPTLVSKNRNFPEIIWTRKILVYANQIFYQGQNRIFGNIKEIWGLEEKFSWYVISVCFTFEFIIIEVFIWLCLYLSLVHKLIIVVIFL
jgi:hypothetical protein